MLPLSYWKQWRAHPASRENSRLARNKMFLNGAAYCRPLGHSTVCYHTIYLVNTSMSPNPAQVAHNMQFQDFNGAWSKYLQEYDRMAQMYVQQMTERHAIGLMEHQRKLQQELRDKPPKWSKVISQGRRNYFPGCTETRHSLPRVEQHPRYTKKKNTNTLQLRDRGFL